jgi:DNA-binding beta-propeller fold protein YncE
VSLPVLSRRAWIAATAGALGCGRKKATGFQGFCFIANSEGKSVGVVSLDRFRPRKPIALDAAPSAVLAHPSSPKALVLAPESGTVYEIDAGPLTVGRRARAGNLAAAMQLSPDRKSLWVLYQEPAALVEFPLDTLRAGRRIRLSVVPHAFDLSSDGRAAIASRQDRSIVIASLESGDVQHVIDARDEPSLLQWQLDARQLIVGSRPERSVGIFHPESGRAVVRLPLPLEPRHFAVKADGGQIFISGDGMDAVVILYPYRTEVAETMLAGRAPAGMAVTNSLPYLLVTNPETNSLTVLSFDNPGRKLVGVVQVGQEPRHVLLTPDEQYALVLNEKSGDMAVIRLQSLLTSDSLSSRYRPTPLFTMVPVGERPVSAAVVAV